MRYPSLWFVEHQKFIPDRTRILQNIHEYMKFSYDFIVSWCPFLELKVAESGYARWESTRCPAWPQCCYQVAHSLATLAMPSLMSLPLECLTSCRCARCLSFSYEGYLISGDQDANLANPPWFSIVFSAFLILFGDETHHDPSCVMSNCGTGCPCQFLWEAENAQPIKEWQAHEGCAWKPKSTLCQVIYAYVRDMLNVMIENQWIGWNYIETWAPETA